MLVFFRRIRNDIFQRNLQLISIISIIIVIIKKIRKKNIHQVLFGLSQGILIHKMF
jgi:hypothetical protein